ncbi:uridine kinase [Nonomuraea roseoviolacea subsp. roseoviolacea]|uniref:uridine kinase n=1 Tax=Nonomuraea roseoviolacea TaxID=103837 RepID=UPI0031DD53BC
MRVRPISPEALAEELAGRIDALPRERPARVLIDGAPPSWPGRLADALVAPLRVRGRAVVRVSAGDFLRPASLRLEYGRTDPDVFYDDWLDTGALVREVLGPLEPGGTGKVLPALWDSRADRAYRLPYESLPAGGVLLLDGTLLLGRGLPAELSVHLWLSEAALARGTGADERWRLPAYARYEREARPRESADVVVRADRPGHPALEEPG